MTLRRRPVVLAAAGALALGSLALTSRAATPDDIDPRSYYEDYEVGRVEDGGWFPFSAGSADGAASGATASESAGPGRTPSVPRPTEDNTFVDAGTSGPVDPADDALSTFALDVDTGSYGVARTWLRDGRRPPPASVRVEEWVNAQTYDGPADPASGPGADDLAVRTETAASPTCADTQLVRVAVDAREIEPAERPRVNVTLVVDRSGSMDISSRLGLVQSSLALLAQRLDADDTIAVVGFEDRATALLEPTPVSDTDRILATIDELRPGGSTNLAAGLRLGYRSARENATDDAVNAVVLASDGVANVGTSGPGSILDRIEAEGRDGIHLVTVGYGMGNYNDHLMEQLADRGDGFYSYVDTYGEAERLFGSDLVTTLTPVASEARAQVAFDEDMVSSYRLVGYDNRAVADEDFTDLDVDAGELGAGHHATALYEVELATGVEPGTPIGTADVRWRSTGSGDAQQATAEVLAAPEGAEPSRDLQHASVVADLAEALKGTRSRGRCAVDLATLGERAAPVDVPELERLVRQAQRARPAR